MVSHATTVLAGIAANNATLYHRIRFLAPDAAVIVDFADGTSIFIVRDIEMDRARKEVRADRICCAADFEPEGGLSGDRDTALAQAAAECLRRAGEHSVTVDRTLPYLYAHFILQAGLGIEYSENLGFEERRIKRPGEIEHLRHAQKITGDAMTYAWFSVVGGGAIAFSSITGPNIIATVTPGTPAGVGQVATTTYQVLLQAEDCPGLQDFDLLTITHECTGQ